MTRCDQVPDNPQDGDVFECSHCGYKAEWVVLDWGVAEWVSRNE